MATPGPLEKLQTNVVKGLFAQGAEARAFNGVAGEMLDESQALNKRAVKVRWTAGERMVAVSERVGAAVEPTTGDDDRLARIGKGFGLVRRASVTHDRYQYMLDTAWEIWERGGTAQGIIDALQAQGFGDVRVFEEWEGVLGEPESGYGLRSVVILGPDFGDRGWGPMTLPFVLGSALLGVAGATVDEVSDAVRDILAWKNAFSFPMALVMVFGDEPLLGVTMLPFVLGGSVGYGGARRPLGERSLLGALELGFPLGTHYEISPL